MLSSGYPLEAFTTKIVPDQDYPGEEGEWFLVLTPPYDEETDTILERWHVKKYGIFYWAAYGHP
jgi:hypothetical protein